LTTHRQARIHFRVTVSARVPGTTATAVVTSEALAVAIDTWKGCAKINFNSAETSCVAHGAVALVSVVYIHAHAVV